MSASARSFRPNTTVDDAKTDISHTFFPARLQLDERVCLGPILHTTVTDAQHFNIPGAKSQTEQVSQTLVNQSMKPNCTT
jgi:hypothetical protein